MRLSTCAVCGKENYIGYDLCQECWATWTITGTIAKPEWLQMLVRNEYSFQTNYATIKETVFTDIEDEDEHQVEKLLILSQLQID